jgi:hypothetical protein
MSLAIDVNRVSAVLLADGWHKVSLFGDGRSSFDIDAYEYLEDGNLRLGGGVCQGVVTTGAVWFERGQEVCVPLTSILAVKLRKRKPTDVDTDF